MGASCRHGNRGRGVGMPPRSGGAPGGVAVGGRERSRRGPGSAPGGSGDTAEGAVTDGPHPTRDRGVECQMRWREGFRFVGVDSTDCGPCDPTKVGGDLRHVSPPCGFDCRPKASGNWFPRSPRPVSSNALPRKQVEHSLFASCSSFPLGNNHESRSSDNSKQSAHGS